MRQAQRIDELDGAVDELLDGVAWLTGGVAVPDVVEHDHVVVRGQEVQELRIPPVDGAAVAVQEEQRDTAPRTQSGRTAPNAPRLPPSHEERARLARSPAETAPKDPGEVSLTGEAPAMGDIGDRQMA